MKIHGICMVKNESDIITQTLESAVRWCDFIYVYDNGSTDGTWEKVVKIAQKYEQIVPYKQESKPYSESLRCEVFNHYRVNSSEGDWWCQLDADEIYIDDPRTFLAEVPKKYGVVWAASFQYYFTDKDLELYNQNPSLYADDVPVEDKCRYYINNWSEPRFFKYKKSLEWENNLVHEKGKMPKGLGTYYPKRIRLKHFQYRSPQQIQKRLDTRLQGMQNGIFQHEKRKDFGGITLNVNYSSSNNDKSHYGIYYDKDYYPQSWKERVVEASKLLYDAHNENYIIDEDSLPSIKFRSRLIKKILRTLPFLSRF